MTPYIQHLDSVEGEERGWRQGSRALHSALGLLAVSQNARESMGGAGAVAPCVLAVMELGAEGVCWGRRALRLGCEVTVGLWVMREPHLTLLSRKQGMREGIFLEPMLVLTPGNPRVSYQPEARTPPSCACISACTAAPKFRPASPPPSQCSLHQIQPQSHTDIHAHAHTPSRGP